MRQASTDVVTSGCVQGISGVPQLPAGYNPATWMLEVSGGGAKMHIEAVDVDFAAQYHGSALCAQAARTVDALVAERGAATAPLALATRYAVPFTQQTKMAVWKQGIVYWCAPLSHDCAPAFWRAVEIENRNCLPQDRGCCM